MNLRYQPHQRGITFLGLLFIAVLVAASVTVMLQVVPTAIEYRAVAKAVDKAALGSTVPEVRAIFDRAAAIDNISSINGQDLDVTKENDKVVVSFSYEREIPLVGPAFLTLKYKGRSR